MASVIIGPRIETWAPVAGWEDHYSVSSLGRVRQEQARRGTRPRRLMTPQLNTVGYLSVQLRDGGRRAQYLVHRLVMAAFVGDVPDGQQVNHMNGQKTDNRRVNLEYVTRSKNVRHAFRIGLQAHGERRAGAKLTLAQVNEIRASRSTPRVELARRYGVAPTTIGAVLGGHSWKGTYA